MKRFIPDKPPTTLRAHVFQRLRKDILDGKYKPGDRLNESSIARELEISRIPVREALLQLREYGLVMNRARRGMFVTALTHEEVQQINSVRIILEVEALRLARSRITPKIAALLKTIVDKMESSSSSVSEAAALDLDFHRAIWTAAGNQYLTEILDPLATLSFAHNLLERVGPGKEWRLNHHRALLEIVLSPRDADVDSVRTALMKHLRAAYADDAAIADPKASAEEPLPKPRRKATAKKPA